MKTIKELMEKVNKYLNTSPVFEYAPGFVLEIESDSGRLLQIHIEEGDWSEMRNKLENNEPWIRVIRAPDIDYEKDGDGEELPFIESYDHYASVEETIKTLEDKDGNHAEKPI